MRSNNTNREHKQLIEEYCKNYISIFYFKIKSKQFLTQEKDLGVIEEFVEILDDLKDSNKDQKQQEHLIKIIGIIVYRLRFSDYQWANLRLYFTLERIKKVIKKFMHVIMQYFAEFVSKDFSNSSSQSAYTIEMIQTLQYILKILMEDDCEIQQEEIMKKFSVESLDNVTADKTVIAMNSKVIEKLEENKKKEEKMKTNELNTLDKDVMKGLLKIDVTQNTIEEFNNDLFNELIMENQRQFNYEEMGITKYFEYLEKRVDIVFNEIRKESEKSKTITENNKKLIKGVNDEIQELLMFIMCTFEKIEPTCIGTVAKVLIQMTELHYLLS